MKNRGFKSFAVGAVAAIFGVTGAGVSPAFAQSPAQTYQANLTSLNGSGTSGTATVTTNGNQVTVRVNTNGASANLAHAQHLHIGGRNVCPDPSADTNNSGFINTVEGQPAYGEVKVSLTTSGDVGAGSALAVDRFPVATADGQVSYERTFTLPKGVSMNDLSKAVVVQHGISKIYDDKAKYDGAPRSTLDESLPFEATAPAACGKLTSAPAGGVGAGGGGTAGLENTSFIALGSAGLMAAAGAYWYSRRATAGS